MRINIRKTITAVGLILITLMLVWPRNEEQQDEISTDFKRQGEFVKHELLLKYIKFEKFDSDPAIYKEQCEDLFKRLRNPDPAMIFNVPLREPPSYLKDAFEQFGDFPIGNFRYYNEANDDDQKINFVGNKEIQDIQRKAFNKEFYSSYNETNFYEVLKEYSYFISDKKCAVIGTRYPWIEALVLMFNASDITTLGYSMKKYENPKLKWKLLNDFLDEILKSKQFEQFDFSASFSSIEHSGLGRYGDPLSPFGDLEAVRQVHCLLKPGGIFFLGVPWGDHDRSYFEFNAHRIYSSKRMELLLKDWKVIESRMSNTGHKIFTLQKL